MGDTNIGVIRGDPRRQREMESSSLPFAVAWTGVLIIIVAFFFPYASATERYQEYLEAYPDSMFDEGLDITNEEAVNISMLEFGRLYAVVAETARGKGIGIACVVMISLIGAFSLLTLLFALLKKPIALFIFNGFTFGMFRLLCWDFEDRGVIPTSTYVWGTSYSLYHWGAAIILIGAIWLFVDKRRLRRI